MLDDRRPSPCREDIGSTAERIHGRGERRTLGVSTFVRVKKISLPRVIAMRLLRPQRKRQASPWRIQVS